MSFDIWLDCFKEGDKDFFPTTILEKVFAPSHVGDDGTYWLLQFPDGVSCRVRIANEPMTAGFAINRPSGNGLYDAIYEIMSRTQTVLSWSFGGAAVANPSVIPHLPPEMIQSVGVPTVVHSGDDIIKAIEAS